MSFIKIETRKIHYSNLDENIFCLIVTFLSAFHVSAFWTRDKSRVPELSRIPWTGECPGAKLTIFQRSGTENGWHSIRSPRRKTYWCKNYDWHGSWIRGSSITFVISCGLYDFLRNLLYGWIENPIPFFFFFLRFVFLTTFDTLSCTIDRFRNNQKLSREYGLTSVEAPGNTRNASRISSISGRKSERSWKQIYWNNRTDSCETSFTSGENISR